MHMVHVTWLDSCHIGITGWIKHEKCIDIVNSGVVKVQSCGFLVHDDGEQVALMQSATPTQTANVIMIPRSAVQAIKSLGIVDAP